MHPTQPLHHSEDKAVLQPEASIVMATGAEVWHNGEADIRDRQLDMGGYEPHEPARDPDSAASSPTLVDTASPSYTKRHRTVTFAMDDDTPDSDSASDCESLTDRTTPYLPDPVPWRTLIPLLMFMTADAMTYSVLFPIITDMLTSFRPAIAPDMIGLYAGLGEGVMMLVEAVCSPFWARAADKYGRRGCLIWGFSVTVVGSAAIGWSSGVVSIIIFRSILGLNPSGVLCRLMGAEIATPSNRAKIFSILSPSFSIGMLMGTLLGGVLAHPYGRLPGILGGTSTIWRDWPFALPCVVIAFVDLFVVVFGWFMLIETKRPSRRVDVMELKGREGEEDASEALLKARERESTDLDLTSHIDLESSTAPAGPPKDIIRATLAVPSFVLLITVFLLFQISTFSWDGMYAVFTYTSPEHGGLGLSVDTIGVLYSVSYLASFTMNPLLLPGMTRRYGAKRSLIVALGCWVVLGLLLPISQWASVESRAVMWGVVGIQLIFRALGSFGWALCDVLTLSCFDDYPELMATSSAISCIGGAGGRAFGPALSGWLYSIASEQPQHSWGRQISWMYIALASSPALIMAFQIPRSADERASASGTGEQDGGAAREGRKGGRRRKVEEERDGISSD